MDSDLEDSVSLATVEDDVAPPTSRRRLQRLHRVDDAPAKPTPTPEWGDEDAHNPDYWDEEDEYAEQLHKGDTQVEDDQGSDGACVTAGDAYKRATSVVEEEDAESDAEQGVEEDGFVGGDLHADTQRLLRGTLRVGYDIRGMSGHTPYTGQAKYDALGKGHEPVIKPLAGVLSKLKMRAAEVKAKCVLFLHVSLMSKCHCCGTYTSWQVCGTATPKTIV